MHENFNSPYFLLGLAAGIVFGLIVGYFAWYFVVKKGKKKRRFDERYKGIQAQAKSLSWAVMMLVLVIGYALVYIFEGPSLTFFLIIAVYVIGMVSYGIAAFVMEKKS
ncbi:DUF3796 domain-containing protein [Sporosarcina sp. FSL K6-3457]|uniref:DUF3796 domain-containing protein n=1 Tax=Sporosarcina sp. FSL K6-3457 TaxID=2978204 RepID=UPI0030F4CB1D